MRHSRAVESTLSSRHFDPQTVSCDTMNLRKIDDNIWEIPREGEMKVPGRIYASEELIKSIRQDRTVEQIRNVSHLPGIYKYSIAMPDAHQGYGFPIGGVAALDVEDGGISPGGVGYDINCGVRLVKTPLKTSDVTKRLKELINTIFQKVPSGVGKSSNLSFSREELKEVIEEGASWAVENGYGLEEDLENMEEGGKMKEADSSYVSDKAMNRGKNQVGCLGAGNHFLEIENVGRIDDKQSADSFGLFEDQVCIMIHTGSRGFGHQVCTDYLREIEKKYKNKVRKLPDRELVYAPGGTEMAERYFKAMSCAVNFAFANRQLIMHQVRKAFEEIFDLDYSDLELVYDVCHNVAKKEKHTVDGDEKEVYVHRKGATRAFPPGHGKVPEKYRDVGQPVLIPGNMGEGSYLLRGNEDSMELSFGTAPHGSGRIMSRTRAKGKFWGETVKQDLMKEKGILVKAASMPVIAEEAPGAYKNLEEVVNASHDVGVAKKVLKLDPMGVIKG